MGRDRAGDNLAVYEDHVYCFSCGYREWCDNLSHFQDQNFGYNICVGEGLRSPPRHQTGLSLAGWKPQEDAVEGFDLSSSSIFLGTPQDLLPLEEGKAEIYDEAGMRKKKENEEIFGGILSTEMSNVQDQFIDVLRQRKDEALSALRLRGEAFKEGDEGQARIKVPKEYKLWRGITADTMRFFDVYHEGNQIVFDYGKAQLTRDLSEEKKYRWQGEATEATLFGKNRFNAGGRSITITEGAHKALAVWQMTNTAAVSVKGAASAVNDCHTEREYLLSFEKVILALDSDEAGQEATQGLVRLFGANRVRYVLMSALNDPTDYLQQSRQEEFVKAWQNAKPCLPKGIIGTYDEIHTILQKEDQGSIASYPFPTLDKMAYGVRSGELVLLAAQQKIGKTEVLRAMEHHVLSTTDHKVGIIHLEESEKRSVQGLASYHLNLPCHLPDTGASADDVERAFRDLTKADGRCFFYTHFGSDDPSSILDTIRDLVSGLGCKFVFIDHLTMLVSGHREDDERRTLDYLATRFAMLTRELDFTMFVVSHVNDDGLPRGSRMISKTCDLHLYLERNKVSNDADTRNTTFLTVRDNRFSGLTGPAGQLIFDPKTFKITEKEIKLEPDFNFEV